MNPFFALNYKNYLPALMISTNPMIVAVQEYDFLTQTAAFVAALRVAGKGYLLLQLSNQRETPDSVATLAAILKGVKAQLPKLDIVVLTDTPREQSALAKAGITTCFCHQSALLDERRYPLIESPGKTCDAVYFAPIVPENRHALAAEIPSLCLIGSFTDEAYGQTTLAALPQASWIRNPSASRLSREIAAAWCGLSLSAEEGAHFRSTEYLLRGIPVVNTPNRGGRDEVMPAFAVKTVEPTPAAIARAVAEWKRSAPPPGEIRRAVLEKLQPHRDRLTNLIAQIFHENGNFSDAPSRFRHKLGLGETPSHYTLYRYGLLRADG